MGIEEIKDYCIATRMGNLVFFIIKPTNISVLPDSSISALSLIHIFNDNYDDVYHAVREGYAAGWYPDGTGRWDESVDTGDVYGQPKR